jgi:hypothetical protein
VALVTVVTCPTPDLPTLLSVTPSFDPGALMSRSYTLARGPRVRLRLATPRDQRAIQGLLTHAAYTSPELMAARLVRVNPRQRLVICALGLIGSSETLLGIGEVALGDGVAAEPGLVVVDDRVTEGLQQLLRDALAGRALAISRSRAA